MTLATYTDKKAPQTVREALKSLDDAKCGCIDYHESARFDRGKIQRTYFLRMYVDDYARDERRVIEITFHSWGFSRIETRFLSGYDKDANRWLHWGRQTRREYENKRGLKLLRDSVQNVFDASVRATSRGAAVAFTAYREGSGWRVY